MSLNAWPSLKTLVYKGCLIRLSSGYTKRANSANPLYINNNEIDNIVEFSENIFRISKLQSVFKIIDVELYQNIDNTLKENKYQKVDLTHVMQCDLQKMNILDDLQVEIDNKFSSSWINTFLEINNIKTENKETAIGMLKSITVDLLVASIKVNNKIIACGYGACEGDYIGVFDIIVDKDFRGNGYGKKLISGLLSKAKERNIKYAYLQVVSSNNVAKNLYTKLKFKRIYDYWYRIK